MWQYGLRNQEALHLVAFDGLQELEETPRIGRLVVGRGEDAGGLGVGLMALWLPQILGGGYGWIQEAMDGQLALRLLLVLVFAKALAFAGPVVASATCSSSVTASA